MLTLSLSTRFHIQLCNGNCIRLDKALKIEVLNVNKNAEDNNEVSKSYLKSYKDIGRDDSEHR